jgi:hypothetical protein
MLRGPPQLHPDVAIRNRAPTGSRGEIDDIHREEPHMKKKILGAASVVTAMFLSACAGRAPQPVAVVQPQDRYADCAAIIAEVQANNQKIQDLAGDEGSKVTQNVAAGVVGLFIWPVWFGMDFQGTAGKEVAALQSRQQYLAVMAEQRNCAAPVSTPVVARAVPAPIPVPVATAPLVTPTTAATPTRAAETPAPTPAGTWPNIIPPLSPSAAPAPTLVFDAPAAPTPGLTPPPVPAPLQPVAVLSPPASAAMAAPEMPAAASDANSYEEAQQQYRKAEQQYQRQLELQRGQGR